MFSDIKSSTRTSTRWQLYTNDGHTLYKGGFYTEYHNNYYVTTTIYAHSTEIEASEYTAYQEDIDGVRYIGEERSQVPLPSKKAKALYKLKSDPNMFRGVYDFPNYMERIFIQYAKGEMDQIIEMETFSYMYVERGSYV